MVKRRIPPLLIAIIIVVIFFNPSLDLQSIVPSGQYNAYPDNNVCTLITNVEDYTDIETFNTGQAWVSIDSDNDGVKESYGMWGFQSRTGTTPPIGVRQCTDVSDGGQGNIILQDIGNGVSVSVSGNDLYVCRADKTRAAYLIKDHGAASNALLECLECVCTAGTCCDGCSYLPSNIQPNGLIDENVCEGNDVVFNDYSCTGLSETEEVDSTFQETCATNCADGECVECQDECTVEGAYRCSGDNNQRCLDTLPHPGGDGCLEWVTWQICEFGCEDTTGRCNAEPFDCTDSDGGINYQERGVMNDGINNFPDSCVDNTLYEYYCLSPTEPELELYECPVICSGGACLDDCASYDINCDSFVNREELGLAITQYLDGSLTRSELGNAIQSWVI